MTALLTAHDLYWELLEVAVPPASPVKQLDITQAWIIARDIQTDALGKQRLPAYPAAHPAA